MIRLNLLQNRFGSPTLSKSSGDTGFLSEFTTTSMKAISSGKGKRIALIVIGVVLVGVAATVGYLLMHKPTQDVSLVPEPAKTQKPPAVPPKPVAKDSVKPVAVAAKDSVKKDTVKPVEVKTAKVEPPPPPPKPEPKKPEPKKPEPKPEPVKPPPPPPPPPPQVVSIQPAVVAPALAGGVVDLVMGESKSKASTAPAPTRFEELTALSRLAYQRFAFERILSVVRQVSPPDIRYNTIRILSPGILMIQGSAKDSGSIKALMQGLLAQSLVDTSLVKKPNGQFALAARLPYSASFGGSEGAFQDFQKTINQARDLSATQGLDLSKPTAPRLQEISGMHRAQWKLAATGGWDGVAKWISALQSMQCPIGFTSLKLSAGPDGKLRLEADAISYGK